MPFTTLDDSTQSIRKRKNVEQPLFLSKTFAMLSECPPTIACWNNDGTSFYVIDQKALSERMIPQFFKHNNFSSFVRQLNFYGFHKVKSNSNFPASKDEDTRILQFKHPLFQRDRPELLNDIRRAAPSITQVPVAQDYELLKCQISELSSQVEYLTNTVNELRSSLKRPNRNDDILPTSKIAKLSSKWDSLDDDTIDMLLSLDKNVDENEIHQPTGYHQLNNNNHNININNNIPTTMTSNPISSPTINNNIITNNNNHNNISNYQNYDQNSNLEQNSNIYSTPITVERRGAPYSHNVFKTGNIPTLILHKQSGVSFTHTSYPEFNKIKTLGSNETLKTVTPLNQANAILGGFLTEFYSTLTTPNLNKSNSSFSQNSNSSLNNTISTNYPSENLYNQNSEFESDRISPTPSSSSTTSSSSSSSSSTTTSSASFTTTSTPAKSFSSTVTTYSTNSRNAIFSD